MVLMRRALLIEGKENGESDVSGMPRFSFLRFKWAVLNARHRLARRAPMISKLQVVQNFEPFSTMTKIIRELGASALSGSLAKCRGIVNGPTHRRYDHAFQLLHFSSLPTWNSPIGFLSLCAAHCQSWRDCLPYWRSLQLIQPNSQSHDHTTPNSNCGQAVWGRIVSPGLDLYLIDFVMRHRSAELSCSSWRICSVM